MSLRSPLGDVEHARDAEHAAQTDRRVRAIVKNAIAAGLVLCVWYGLQSGYFAPDRPTRAQWAEIEKAKTQASGRVVFQSDFKTLRAGAGPVSPWGYYNGASGNTVTYDQTGVTIDYKGVGWIGARLDIATFEPGAIYRIVVDAETSGQPGAFLVRNRQRDLMRERLPVGRHTATAHFVAPPGRFDRMYVAFIPDPPANPQGIMKILSVRLERMGE